MRWIAAIWILAALSAAADGPATRPVGLSVRGRVSITAGLDVQRPDLTRVVAYLDSSPQLDAGGAPTEAAIMSQKDKAFVPSFLVIGRGTSVEFPNCDHFDHNVFSRSKAAPAFDLDRYPCGQSKSRTFDKVGVVQVFCNIHPSMKAQIVITPNRFFGTADAEGRFEIKDIPEGEFDLVLWHERCGETRKKVRAGDAELAVKLEESRENILASDPPRHDKGYGVERGLNVKRERLDLPVVKEAHAAPGEKK